MRRTKVLAGSTVVAVLFTLTAGWVTTAGASAPQAKAPKITAKDFTTDFSAMAQLKDIASKGKGKIAVLLPDTQSSARYVVVRRAVPHAGLQSGRPDH